MSTTTSTLPSEAEAFLAQGPFAAHIGGKAVTATDGATFQTRDPGTGEVIAEVAALGPAEIDQAVQAAQQAFDASGWADLSPSQRGAHLLRLADAIAERKDILAHIESLDAGKILAQAQGDVQMFIDTMRFFVAIAEETPLEETITVAGNEAARAYLPWGPCGFILPWNFPVLLIGWNLSPALAAGNTVVLKPAEDTPLSALYIAQVAQEIGIPDGVINVVTGYGETAGKALSGHPGLKHMAFTGSPEVGRLVAEACGRNLVPVKLELGGKGAAVVFDDVDIEATADALVGAITFHCGQVCCDATRWIIHEHIASRFLAACRERMESIQVGHQLDSDSQMGPVVNEKQRARVLGYLEKGTGEGAEAYLAGGEAPVAGKQGFYVKPALLRGSLDNIAAREEIFGPVAFCTTFSDEAEALRLVNSTDYGLANSVWTQDLDRARRVARGMVAGNSWINAHNVFVHGVPYGGINKSGMGGGVLSKETYLDYLRKLSIVRPL
ncbi:MAG: aldehyde dehydrogenase family protein [Planctomycetota bacterium]